MWKTEPTSSKCWKITFVISMESFGESEILEFYHQNRILSSSGFEQHIDDKPSLAEDYFSKYLESDDAARHYPTAMHIITQPYENSEELLPAYIATWEGEEHIYHTKTNHQGILDAFLQDIGLTDDEDEDFF